MTEKYLKELLGEVFEQGRIYERCLAATDAAAERKTMLCDKIVDFLIEGRVGE